MVNDVAYVRAPGKHSVKIILGITRHTPITRKYCGPFSHTSTSMPVDAYLDGEGHRAGDEEGLVHMLIHR